MEPRKKTRKGGPNALVVAAVATVALIVIVGALSRGTVEERRAEADAAKLAAEVAGAAMDIDLAQAKARVKAVEPDAGEARWTVVTEKPAGLVCNTLETGSAPTRVWNICGLGDQVVRITVNSKGAPVVAGSDEAALLMTKLLGAAAPEVADAYRKTLVEAMRGRTAPNDEGEAIVGRAHVVFANDEKGSVARLLAQAAR